MQYTILHHDRLWRMYRVAKSIGDPTLSTFLPRLTVSTLSFLTSGERSLARSERYERYGEHKRKQRRGSRCIIPPRPVPSTGGYFSTETKCPGEDPGSPDHHPPRQPGGPAKASVSVPPPHMYASKVHAPSATPVHSPPPVPASPSLTHSPSLQISDIRSPTPTKI